MDLIKRRTPVLFSEKLLAEASQISKDAPRDLDAERRRDLRGLRSFAVDDVSTTEV